VRLKVALVKKGRELKRKHNKRMQVVGISILEGTIIMVWGYLLGSSFFLPL
jgi:uncharacterized membrane protein